MKRLLYCPFALLALSRIAAAQVPAVADIEVPAVVAEAAELREAVAADEAIELANIVRSAVKGITTVQEAPAIVTVVTGDEIRERQFSDFQQIIDTIPGWGRVGYWHSNIQSVLVRGQQVAALFLHDGVALSGPFLSPPAFYRAQPLELIKRAEVITGPGGVLWGSVSLLGIMNVITKDAEDIEGVEVGGSLGDGVGDRRAARAYAMAGASDIAGTKLKLFAHGSVESFKGIGIDLPVVFSRGTLPNPTTPNVYGPLTRSDPKRSFFVMLDGKLTYDKLQLRWWVPYGTMYRAAGLSGQPVRDQPDPNDPTGISATNRIDHFDRYGVLEYRTRFLRDRAGLTAHAYAIQFVREFDPLTVLAPSSTLPGGLLLKTSFSSYRVGGAFDGDVELARQMRVLYGAEAFHDWKPITSGQSRQGEGTGSSFPSPQDLTRVSLLCPRRFVNGMLVPLPGCPLTSAFNANRTIIGVYVNPQYRPSSKLIFDAGARVSVAPSALGSLSYKANPSFSGAVVWSFVPGWHLKLNYTEGFRPPTFNGTNSNGEAVQIGGDPKLLVEQSRAGQAEINARIFKGERSIRELSFRVDGSMTRLTNVIEVVSGRYNNSGERSIASAEFFGKMYLQGGHRIELGYTWLRVDTADRGRLRTIPEHWFNLATVWSLWPKKLSATTNLRVTAATEDANRLVEYRGIGFDADGRAMSTVRSAATDLVLDRLPPIAELFAGLQLTPTPKFAITASVYNALYGHSYQPDAFADYEPRLEYLPNPFEGFRAYLTASLQY
jgi:outer membrane receptor protein involved in Fe transport